MGEAWVCPRRDLYRISGRRETGRQDPGLFQKISKPGDHGAGGPGNGRQRQRLWDLHRRASGKNASVGKLCPGDHAKPYGSAAFAGRKVRDGKKICIPDGPGRGETPEQIKKELEKKQPHNYKGHAISTSDVMILNDNGITTVYYVNKDAFIEISDFMKVASSENGGLTKDTVGYEIEGKDGSWEVIDYLLVEGKNYFLMEHEQYGKDVAYVVLNQDGKVIVDSTYNGFDDAVKQKIFDSLHPPVQEQTENSKPKLDNWQKYLENGEYLRSAKEIQIKMAQGAKPGEGGHLPGKKVYPWIAKTRLSTPGVSLISPPPHHDIYSIEDLAQLIYDLKNANKNARISVKLVSEAGVGTIASGVAKAGAQVILISGYDGGTGAAPRSSIHNAGLPWELGLAEAHQTLTMNGLRNKVIIETDGKLMSGRDVAIAAMLGAEEFGFATAPLVTMGCVMMRVCNLDTCPVGIATQNPELRKRFAGKPEYVVNFMRFIAQELREYMAKLGVKTVDELVGRTDFLEAREDVEGSGRASKVDLSNILNNPYVKEASSIKYDKKNVYDFELEKTVDEKILIKKLSDAMDKKQKRSVEVDVTNTDRALGTLLGAEITRRFGESLAEDTYTVKCTGAGGQSFGAFIPKGLTLELVGDSNDYFGKGLSGGKLIVYPPTGVSYKEDENIIIGNVALYGATSGKAFINGVAGERFCVRNSGATAVVEGTGDHGCEYMTGGRVVVLGRTGKNFAAGMSGGVAYVLDDDTTLYKRVNKQLVSLEPVTNKYDVLELKQMITEHVAYTNSKKGKEVLDNFGEYLPKFKKIMPHDYKKMLNMIVQMEEKGLSSEQAQIEAFYAATK